MSDSPQRFLARLCTMCAVALLGLLAAGLMGSDLDRGKAEQSSTDSQSAEQDETEAAGAEAQIVEPPISDFERDHWAYYPILPPELPTVQRKSWLRTSVDLFVLKELEARGLEPAEEANRGTLLRRVSLDLTGVPPTPEALAEFERDSRPDAYERQVDRLLASPAYGERWAQHWLDLARFAETDGFELDKVRPNAWRYRNWVIDALNADMSYRQFVQLQLAGDLLDETRHQIATMFGLAGPDMPDINDQHQRRHDRLNDLTATVGQVLLGLQIGCAQCHDHKYDPLSQADFYRLRAVFEPAVPPLRRDVGQNVLVRHDEVDAARLWVRGDHRRPGPELEPGVPRVVATAEVAARMDEAEDPRLELARWLFNPANPLTARVIVNRVWQYHFGTGLFASSSDVGVMGIPPSHPELLDHLACELRTHGWSLKHLHRLIVCSATYRQASRRTAESVVDWGRRLEVDPNNELYSRFPRRRLDGETVRDAMLSVAGLLSAERAERGVMPPLPDELVQTLLRGQWETSARQADHYLRSIYVFARRNLRYPIFEAFDRPDANASCPRRDVTTTAPQSLVLLNSRFALEVARHLAGRTTSGSRDLAAWTRALYRIVLSRDPRPGEVERIERFVEDQRRLLAEEGRAPEELALPAGRPASELPQSDDPYLAAAWVDVCLALLNSSEFLYVE